MSDISDRIIRLVHQDVARRQEKVPLEHLKEICNSIPPARNPYSCFRCQGAVTVISEIRRKDPLRQTNISLPNPTLLAKEFVKAGSSIISVNTEPNFYGGSLKLFETLRADLDVPMMFRNFIVSSYQLLEARALGADLVLLIAPLLYRERLIGLLERSLSLGLTPVVEVHSRLDALNALEAGAKIISVSQKSLRTLSDNLDNFSHIIDIIPPEVLVIVESGIKKPSDVFTFAQEGADAVLVTTSVLDTDNPRGAISNMKAAASHPALASMRRQQTF